MLHNFNYTQTFDRDQDGGRLGCQKTCKEKAFSKLLYLVSEFRGMYKRAVSLWTWDVKDHIDDNESFSNDRSWCHKECVSFV